MKNKAQSLADYLIMVCIIISVLISMGAYIKRGIQGKMRQSADEISGGLAYSPGATRSNYIIERAVEEYAHSESDETTNETTSTSNTAVNQTTTRLEETLPLYQEPERW